MNVDGHLQSRPRESRIFDRQAHEWYVEPLWVSHRLMEAEGFAGGVYDPACGRGNILASAAKIGIDAGGSDVVSRGEKRERVIDFLLSPLTVREEMRASGLRNVVCNPPFALGREFAELALDAVADGDKVAMIFPIRRLNAAGAWLLRTPLARIWFLTPRPSMPNGEHYETMLGRGKSPRGGTQDFCWLVWCKGVTSETVTRWLHRDRGAS